MSFLASLLFLSAVRTGEAGVYNLHLATDNVPDLTDMDSFVLSATRLWESPQDKCIAVWLPGPAPEGY